MNKDCISHIRTDLAIESAMCFSDDELPLSGVAISHIDSASTHIKITQVHVKNQEGSSKIGKPVGRYITLETPYLGDDDTNYHKEITQALMEQLEVLIPNICNKKVLVAGIGNREITPDALGPEVVEHLYITRHLIKEFGQNSEITKGMGTISAIAPGVMAQTGMEGREVIEGIIRQTKPDVLIVVDALAARSVSRLNSTIQLTDTGIHPGAGVGNQRNELSEAVLGIPVVAIGIPTVIDAATILYDAMEHMLEQDIISTELAHMIMTPTDIDETIGKISFTISEAINSLCHHHI